MSLMERSVVPPTCKLQLNDSATAATPAKSDDPNEVVLTMKESNAPIYIAKQGFGS